jgi:hypothetical protein
MSAATAHTARRDDHARATALEACEPYAAPDTLPAPAVRAPSTSQPRASDRPAANLEPLAATRPTEARRPKPITENSESAFVAGHDAPLIGEPAATHGRSATEGGDERAWVKKAIIRSISSLANRATRRGSTTERPRRTARPGTRTLVGTLARLHRCTMRRSSTNTPRRAGASQRKVAMRTPVRRARHPFEIQFCGSRRSRTAQADWTSVSNPHAAAFVAATKGGDAHVGAKRYPFERQRCNRVRTQFLRSTR